MSRDNNCAGSNPSCARRILERNAIKMAINFCALSTSRAIFKSSIDD